MKRSILVISNGRGEDSIAVTLLENLKKILREEELSENDLQIVALPLVGEGLLYKNAGYPTAAAWKNLPSHGFFSVFGLLRDLRRGLLDNWRGQISIIEREAQTADLILTIGDIWPVLLASLYGHRKKIVHMATAISVYLRHYTLAEIWLFKKYVSCVICRDLPTCAELQKFNVNAFYAGNPMLDDPMLRSTNTNLGLDKKRRRIVLIPSSREDAYGNILRMLNVVKHFATKNSFQFVISLAPNLTLERLRAALGKSDWAMLDLRHKKTPIAAELLHKDSTQVYVVHGYFRECLDEASLAIGMTGTGNEQIAGLGLPLILLKGKSPAASRGRLQHYKKLLDGAVFAPRGSDERIARAASELLSSSKRLQSMADAGRARLGDAGGSYFITRKIWYYLYA
ncbi:MAG: lipid-A-disaccharide synthase-related protein [Candidatus Margulisbacteria bacterium]|nr:lipid-A-disaccharide synthase-related protein [Candidatus Margulisiibacteriota bacterium]